MFYRRGHYRTNCYGTTFYVQKHGVKRSKINWTFHSITIPNALCPVCSEQVFYYENISGSRVYFDELGPDWPKHPCTDNGKKPRKPKKFITGKERKYKWQNNGWSPLINLTEEGSLGDWSMLGAEEEKSYKLFWLKNVVIENISSPVFVKEEKNKAKFQWWEAQNNCKRTQCGHFDNEWIEIKIQGENYNKKEKFILWDVCIPSLENKKIILKSDECMEKPNQASRYHIKNLDDKVAVIRLLYHSIKEKTLYLMVYKLT